MAKSVIQYDLLISCPGDIQREIDIIKEVVEQFEKTPQSWTMEKISETCRTIWYNIFNNKNSKIFRY